MMLAETLHIDAERALNLFYTTKVYQQLSDPKYGLQLMSDDYILEKSHRRTEGNSITLKMGS